MGGGDPNEKCNFFYVNGFCWQSRLSRVATTTASQQLASQQPLADLDGGISGPAEVRGPDLDGFPGRRGSGGPDLDDGFSGLAVVRGGHQLHGLVGPDHCSRHHLVNGDNDGNNREDDGTDRAGRHATGVGDAVPKSKKPKAGCGKKEPKRAAPKRCQKDSSRDHGTECRKTKSY